MAVVLVHQGPTVTREGYDETVRRLTEGRKDRMESPSDWPSRAFSCMSQATDRAAFASLMSGNPRRPATGSGRS
jgi:hypothetical protein